MSNINITLVSGLIKFFVSMEIYEIAKIIY